MLPRIRLSLILALSLTVSTLAAANPHWVATWGASPAPQLDDTQCARVQRPLPLSLLQRSFMTEWRPFAPTGSYKRW